MKTIRNFKEKICSFENIELAYRHARKCKRYRPEVLEFTDRLEENLIEIQRELETMEYASGDYYEFMVMEPKPRIIMAQRFRHRVIQWAIYQIVYPEMEKTYIDTSYACIREKGTLKAVEKLSGWVNRCYNIEQDRKRRGKAEKYWYLQMDISLFFNTIDHDISIDLHVRKADGGDFARYLFNEVFDPPNASFGLPYGVSVADIRPGMRIKEKGMPIGNIMSQENANVVLNRLDMFCKHTLRIKRYARYMDDFIIIDNDLQKIELCRKRIPEFVESELNLMINPKKVKVNRVRNGIDFCGYFIKPYRVTMRKKSCMRMKKNLRKIMKEYRSGVISMEKALQTVRSYQGILSHCQSRKLCEKIFGKGDEQTGYEKGWFVLCRSIPNSDGTVMPSIK